jgi:hypothetical protein
MPRGKASAPSWRVSPFPLEGEVGRARRRVAGWGLTQAGWFKRESFFALTRETPHPDPPPQWGRGKAWP